MYIGAHLSRAEGLVKMVEMARKIDAIQFFISPPKSFRVPSIPEAELRDFTENMKDG